MLIINPLKPFYDDKDNNCLRMGNFKNTAKEICYSDDSLVELFRFLKSPIEKEDLINKMLSITNYSRDEYESLIDYLVDEHFIIDYNLYNKIIKNNKYNRQNLYFSMVSDNIKEWTIDNQPNILILGLGGIGSNVALTLSRSGFTNFTFVDCDIVEESNLIRQLPYKKEHIGIKKTEALESIISDSDNVINIKNVKIEKEEDIRAEIKNSDFVLCTLDKPQRIIRRLINSLCVKYNKPVIFAGFSEHVAMIGPFVVPGKSACLKCIEKEMNEEPLYNVIMTPSYGPICMMISSIVSNEIINYYYKYNKKNLIGKTLMFDILDYNRKIMKWKKKEKCEVCDSDSK